MDSHEEKIQEIIERNKELEATEERKEEPKKYKEKKWQERPWINYIWVPVPELGLHHLVMIVIKTIINLLINLHPLLKPLIVLDPTPQALLLTLLSKPRGGGLQLGGKRLLLVEPCHQVTVLMNHYLLLVNQCLPIRQQ